LKCFAFLYYKYESKIVSSALKDEEEKSYIVFVLANARTM